MNTFTDRILNTIKSIQAWKDGDVKSKAASPSLVADINGNTITVLVDEGSNLNAISLKVCTKNRIQFSKADVKAKAAGSGNINIVGVTKSNLILTTRFQGIPVQINLGRSVVIPNLGVDCIIGEPGKFTNQIVTDSSQKLISVQFEGRSLSKPYLSAGTYSGFHLCKAKVNATLFPKESYKVRIPSKRKAKILEDEEIFWYNTHQLEDELKLFHSISNSERKKAYKTYTQLPTIPLGNAFHVALSSRRHLIKV